VQVVGIFLTAKDTSLHIKVTVYSSCMQNFMLHRSKMWPGRKENELALARAEARMIDECVVSIGHTSIGTLN